MWLLVVILAIMSTAVKGAKISIILLTKVLILVTNIGPPTVRMSFTVCAVDTETMNLGKASNEQLHSLVSDGTTGTTAGEYEATNGDFNDQSTSTKPSLGKFVLWYQFLQCTEASNLIYIK